MPARLLILAALFASAAGAQTSAALLAQVDEVLHTLAEITGWKVQRQVPAEILARGKFATTVQHGVKSAEHDKDTKAAELTLKMFGLVPQDFNLAQESADLISEQAAAFYDYNKKRLFVLDSTQDTDEQRLVLAHELAHALADQQHPLKKYLDNVKDDEESTARDAVVEGQASWLSWAYMTKRAGGRAEVPSSLLNRLADSAGADGDAFPVYTQAPLYIRESLTFPYTEGMRFQDAVYRRLGSSAFEKVFQDSPHNTQQILHPDSYLTSKEAAEPETPPLERFVGKEAHKFRLLAEGHVGEFDFSALLRQFTKGEGGREAASHWRGASYKLFEHKVDKYPVLVHISDWDSADAARRFFGMYQEVLRGKWKKMEIASTSDHEVRGTGDNGQFLLRLDGMTVRAIEGARSLER
jgi:hypothetical protein